jgi:hypothetical protein
MTKQFFFSPAPKVEPIRALRDKRRSLRAVRHKKKLLIEILSFTIKINYIYIMKPFQKSWCRRQYNFSVYVFYYVRILVTE